MWCPRPLGFQDCCGVADIPVPDGDEELVEPPGLPQVTTCGSLAKPEHRNAWVVLAPSSQTPIVCCRLWMCTTLSRSRSSNILRSSHVLSVAYERVADTTTERGRFETVTQSSRIRGRAAVRQTDSTQEQQRMKCLPPGFEYVDSLFKSSPPTPREAGRMTEKQLTLMPRRHYAPAMFARLALPLASHRCLRV